MAGKFIVSISMTLTTDRVIAADSEEDAIRIAKELAFDDYRFREGIIDSWDNDYEAYRPKYYTFEGNGETDEEAWDEED